VRGTLRARPPVRGRPACAVGPALVERAAVASTLTAFLDRYRRALAGEDVDALAELVHVPCLVMGPQVRAVLTVDVSWEMTGPDDGIVWEFSVMYTLTAPERGWKIVTVAPLEPALAVANPTGSHAIPPQLLGRGT
jgi:hypothetical protein